MTYKDLVKNYNDNPRDVHTIPINRKPYLWFHVFVEKKNYMCVNQENIYQRVRLKRKD